MTVKLCQIYFFVAIHENNLVGNVFVLYNSKVH